MRFRETNEKKKRTGNNLEQTYVSQTSRKPKQTHTHSHACARAADRLANIHIYTRARLGRTVSRDRGICVCVYVQDSAGPRTRTGKSP